MIITSSRKCGEANDTQGEHNMYTYGWHNDFYNVCRSVFIWELMLFIRALLGISVYIIGNMRRLRNVNRL